jgi:hypothetical protein
MAVSVLASQGYSIYPGSGRLLITANDGTQLIATVANFGGSAQGAAIDTLVTGHGAIKSIQELLESSN